MHDRNAHTILGTACMGTDYTGRGLERESDHRKPDSHHEWGDTLTAVGWGNIGDQIRLTAYEIDDGDYTNKIGIQARNTSHDIGNKDYTGGVYWQIDFSDEDKVKINKEVKANAVALKSSFFDKKKFDNFELKMIRISIISVVFIIMSVLFYLIFVKYKKKKNF